MSNTVKEAFKDFKEESNIIHCNVLNMNLFKKSKKLEIYLESDKEITIEELDKMEDYLKDKFEVLKVISYVEYSIDINNTINEDWEKIREYLSSKYPIVKTILKKSEIEIIDNNIYVILKTKNSEFMISLEFDEIISNLISNIYGKKYKVNYKEEISEEINIEQTKYLEEVKQKVYQETIEEMEERAAQSSSNNVQENIDAENGETPLILGRSEKIKDKIINISELYTEEGRVAIEGQITEVTHRELKNGKILVAFNLYDGTSTVTCKSFVEVSKSKRVLERINKAKRLRVTGNLQYDKFSKDSVVKTSTIVEIYNQNINERKDKAEVKRVELHMHTQMSQMDGVSSTSSLIKQAAKWGMKAIAITDHGNVQAFPEGKHAASETGIKVIYGVEAYLVPDKEDVISRVKSLREYCILDIETTGLQFRTDKITEIGAIKIKDGKVVDTFETLINPEIAIPERVSELTHITDSMVKDSETIKEVLPRFLEFIGNNTVVAHNADFDLGFIRYNAESLGYEFKNEYIDTLLLSRNVFPEFKKHKLEVIASNLGIKVDVAHRALDDVKTLNKVFEIMIERIKENSEAIKKEDTYKSLPSYHAIILVKDLIGLRNLYELVSISHLEYFYKRPRILKSMYKKYSKGLIIGTACEQGELYSAILARKVRRRNRRNCKRL